MAVAPAGRESPTSLGGDSQPTEGDRQAGRQAGWAVRRRGDPVLLRGRSVRLRGVPSTEGVGIRLSGGGAVADSEGAGRANQDGSAGCLQAGAVVARRGVDVGVGSGRGAGGDAGPGACTGGFQERRAQGASATGGVSAVPRSALVAGKFFAFALGFIDVLQTPTVRADRGTSQATPRCLAHCDLKVKREFSSI